MRGVQVTLCLAPRRQVELLTAWHVGRPKRFLNAKVGFYWRRNWSRQVLNIENTQPTAWVRQSKNRRGLLKRGITVGNISPCGWTTYPRLLLAAAPPAPWLAGIPGGSWSPLCPGCSLPVCAASHGIALQTQGWATGAVPPGHWGLFSFSQGKAKAPLGSTWPSQSCL